MKGNQARITWVVLGLIVLLALCLRFYRLDGQSLWADEGNSAALASRSLVTITSDAAHDIHPPLYYYLLHFWARFFGNSEIGLRSFSALTGTILVFVTFLLGRELFSRQTALIASFLAAISPLQIHYSQETRMYVLAALWGALAVYFFARWMRARHRSILSRPKAVSKDATNVTNRSQRASSWTRLRTGFDTPSALFAALYVLFTTAALYTHYFAFTIPIVTNLAYALGMIVSQPLRRPKAIGGWVMAQLMVVVLYYPWLRLAGGQLTTWPAVSEPFSPSFLIQELLRVFSLGLSVEAETTLIVLIFGSLLLLGALPWQLSCVREGRSSLSVVLVREQLPSLLFTLLYLCVPVAAMYILSLSRPAYDPKFLLLATPAFCVLLARGVGAEWLGDVEWPSQDATSGEERRSARVPRGPLVRWAVTTVALLFVTAASAQSLANYYYEEGYARDDYRGLATYIAAVGREGDAIILNAPGQIEIFSYYYQGGLPIYPLPGQRPLDEAKTEEALEDIVARHDRLFALFWGTDESDPGRFIEGWLNRTTFKALDSWHGNVRLAIYAVPREDTSGHIQYPVELTLGDEIALLGYSLAAPEVRAGDMLQLTLFWQPLREIGERYKVFTHILDGRSHIVGQRDAEPVGGARPTTTWEEGEIIADNYGVLVLPATPPGEHQLEIGMYNLETGERLPVFESGELLGGRILLEPIEVLKAESPPLVEALQIQHRRQVDYGPVRLLGYDVSKLGYEHQPDQRFRPGDIVHLTLYWQAMGPIDMDFTLTLQLLDESGNTAVSRDVRPLGGVYPPAVWAEGDILRDQHNLLLSSELSPGAYELFLQVHGLVTDGEPLLLKSLPLAE